MKNIRIPIFKIILFLLYFMTICNINFAYVSVIQNIKYVLIVIVGIYLIPKIKIIFKKGNIVLNILLLLFAFITIYSSYINQNLISDRNTFQASLVYIAIILELFLCIEYIAIANKTKDLVSFYYKLTIIWTLIVDILIIFMPNLYKVTGYYICGGKFFVTYLHILLIVLYIINREINGKAISKVFILILFSISFIISRVVDCNTGMIGILIFATLMLISKKICTLLKRPNVFIVCFIFCFAFCFMYDMILSNELVQNIILNVLGRSLTLTGRTDIYEAIPEIMKDHYLLGYGYGSTYEICMKNIGYANTQNGLMEWVLQIGILGIIVLVSLIYYIFVKFSDIKDLKNIAFPIIAYLYVLSFLGTVEITINIIFIFLISLLYGFSLDSSIKDIVEE